MISGFKATKMSRGTLYCRLWGCDMSVFLKPIEAQARALSAEERAKLAESMLESLHTPLSEIEAAWAEEIEQRVAAFDRGEIPSYAAEDVLVEARRISR